MIKVPLLFVISINLLDGINHMMRDLALFCFTFSPCENEYGNMELYKNTYTSLNTLLFIDYK